MDPPWLLVNLIIWDLYLILHDVEFKIYIIRNILDLMQNRETDLTVCLSIKTEYRQLRGSICKLNVCDQYWPHHSVCPFVHAVCNVIFGIIDFVIQNVKEGNLFNHKQLKHNTHAECTETLSAPSLSGDPEGAAQLTQRLMMSQLTWSCLCLMTWMVPVSSFFT